MLCTTGSIFRCAHFGNLVQSCRLFHRKTTLISRSRGFQVIVGEFLNTYFVKQRKWCCKSLQIWIMHLPSKPIYTDSHYSTILIISPSRWQCVPFSLHSPSYQIFPLQHFCHHFVLCFFFRFLLTEYTWQACTKILTTARIRIKSSIVRTIMDILTTFQSYRPMPSSYLLVYFSYFCNATFESIRWILWSFLYKFSVWLTQTCHSSKYPESNCIMQFNVFALK